jgi:hypothetical protein
MGSIVGEVDIDDATQGAPGQIVGGFDRMARAWVLALFGVGGVLLGVSVPLLSRWAADLPWMPFRGPLSLLGSFDQPWLVWGRPVLGLAAGTAFAIWVILDSPVLHIDRDEIRVKRRGQVERVIKRSTVDAVYRRHTKIIIETSAGRKLFEGEVEGEKLAIRGAFVHRGYPWEGPRD